MIFNLPKIPYYEKEIDKIDEILISENIIKIMQFLYKQDKYTYKTSSKETELQNILDFGMNGEKAKRLYKAYCTTKCLKNNHSFNNLK